ncbi:hypothetical protein ACTXT7_003068 [Hymenolepis weldensis]
MASGNKTMLSARHRRSISKGSDNGLTKPEGEISPVETILVEKSRPPPYTIRIRPTEYADLHISKTLLC